MDRTEYRDRLLSLKGKTIAVVYIFEGENAKGFEHYHIWKSKVISRWLNAIEEIGCKPYIIDVREFVNKAMNNTLPDIDYVLNLNCGSKELCSMSLVPSSCSFLSVPCIPCNSSTIVLGENKQTSNHIARAMGLNVPKNMEEPSDNAIFRPRNFGSSCGITKGKRTNIKSTELYQEFINGYDVTFPILYNPLKERLDFLPGVLYMPYSKNPQWYFGEKEKTGNKTFENYPLYKISIAAQEKLLCFAEAFPIETYGRIDVRIKSDEKELTLDICQQEIQFEDIFFVEINPMPTVKLNNAFFFAFNNIIEQNDFYKCLQLQKDLYKTVDVNSFLLTNSMIAYQNTTTMS